MIPPLEESRKPLASLLGALLVLASAGCAQSLVDRAIDARGGPLESYRKEVDAKVLAGMPGDWTWEVAYRVPESFRWSLRTLGEEQRLIFDGTLARHQLGGASLPPVTADEAVQSQARWFAVTSLDVLDEPGVSWRELPPADLPPGAVRGLSAGFPGDPSRFELFFDERDLLARARGEVALAPIGAGLLDVTFSDYREVDGYSLPFAGEYRLDGTPFLRESVRLWQPNDPALTPETFSGQ